MPVCAAGLALVKHAALGPVAARPRPADFAVFFLLAAGDLLLGLADDSLFRCSDNPLLEQVPGQPWVLLKTEL